MEKIKKTIAPLLVLLLGVLLLAGCKGESGNKSESISSADDKGTTKEEDAALIGGEWESLGIYTYVFNADGTGSWAMGKDVTKFNYEDKGGTLVISWLWEGEVSRTEEYKYFIKGKKLSIEDKINDEMMEYEKK